GSRRGLNALQWGHASSRVETDHPANRVVAVLLASMGPRVFTRGNVRSSHRVAEHPTASMGPRVFTRGNRHQLIKELPDILASMGPRVFTRGNVLEAGHGHPGFPGFNGATRLHAWKHPLGYLGPEELFASMGPRV